MPSWAAVSLVDFPPAISTSTWRSRSVRAKTNCIDSRSGVNAGDQYQHLAFAFGEGENQLHRLPIRRKRAATPLGDIYGRPHEADKNAVFDQRGGGGFNPAQQPPRAPP